MIRETFLINEDGEKTMREKQKASRLLMGLFVCLMVVIFPVSVKAQSAVSSAVVEVNKQQTSQSTSETSVKQTEDLPQTSEKRLEGMAPILLGIWLIVISGKKLKVRGFIGRWNS